MEFLQGLAQKQGSGFRQGRGKGGSMTAVCTPPEPKIKVNLLPNLAGNGWSVLGEMKSGIILNLEGPDFLRRFGVDTL